MIRISGSSVFNQSPQCTKKVALIRILVESIIILVEIIKILIVMIRISSSSIFNQKLFSMEGHKDASVTRTNIRS